MIKIGIWGTGRDTERLFEKSIIQKEHIDFYISADHSQAKYQGKRVILPDNIEWQKSFIVIATSKYYDEIRAKLMAKGLKENYDFTNVVNGCIFDYFIDTACNVKQDYDDIMFKQMFFEYTKMLKKQIKKALFNGETDSSICIARDSRIYEFIKCYEKMSKWIYLDEGIIKNQLNQILYEYFLLGKRAMDVLIKRATDEKNKLIHFTDGTLFEYSQMRDFCVIFQEILLDEDYYFTTEKEKPFIIDGGANVGLAIYYFKTLYPEADIIAFEPMEELYKIINRNIERNNWKNVKVFKCALDAEEGQKKFYVTDSSIAGSVLNKNNNKCVKEVTVSSTRLSKYMNRIVDYLKLDIEGSETKVFEEIKDKLCDVNYVFFEYHEGIDKEYNSLSKILGILNENGFVYNIDKSKFYSKTNKCPMKYVGDVISEVVWARNNTIN